MHSALSNAQAKQYLEAVAAHEGLRQLAHHMKEYRGGMHWKAIAGRDYLYRTTDRRGNARSLGVRSTETENLYAEFSRRKAELVERLVAAKEVTRTAERVNVALRVGAVPNQVANVCRALDDAQLMGRTLMVVGTNAMHAYGYLCGVHFQSGTMVTTEIDLLGNHKSKLSLAAPEQFSVAELLGVLHRIDKSYTESRKHRYRARSSSGFVVDLIRQSPKPPWTQEPDRFFETNLVASDTCNMDWLLSAPCLEQPVVAVNGRVFSMSVPDPRAFAAFKGWMSHRNDRCLSKKGRDLAQARALISLLDERLPQLNNWGALKPVRHQILQQAPAATAERT